MREQIINWLRDRVPPSRLQHILGVEQMAIALATHYHLDAEKAGKAGLMHDLAKNFAPDRLLQAAQAAQIEIDPIQAQIPHLLHADVSAVIAATEFGTREKETLDAIRNHTLGNPGMSPLSCVIFIADALEPNRGNSDILQHLRQTCWQNLYQSVWQTSDYALQHLIAQKCVIHPRTILTRNWALQQTKTPPKKTTCG
ncbi:MAG: bis(5'-nucleosyl)-tetraphosphatase (symmetrical) YqeK [Jaaginema sp. PMC 1079.18]|nr:bis(5'-nucleosyl)-tetraphosphatase (symmetrical) YqeK [Jaaginema sp. PMC 1080.18]MEC4851180.1 bis(5'-nucleosyl)-tetraphosphatase (symmetrical) YqeK [Jaaginema sp. PMC 1079.18]MEC4866117.1 bis(5'-nucleosyl)-tetraphosphatase (symmetrical) YqeK [Jaaginema sp. PMC 1078.18]